MFISINGEFSSFELVLHKNLFLRKYFYFLKIVISVLLKRTILRLYKKAAEKTTKKTLKTQRKVIGTPLPPLF